MKLAIAIFKVMQERDKSCHFGMISIIVINLVLVLFWLLLQAKSLANCSEPVFLINCACF